MIYKRETIERAFTFEYKIYSLEKFTSEEDLLLLGLAGVTDIYGRTALMWTPNIEISRMLIDSGVDVNVKDKNGNTALIWNIVSGGIDIIRLLIDSGAEVNMQDKVGRTPLMWAVREKEYDIVKLLIDSGADFNIRDHAGETVLTLAKDDDIIDLLKKAGAKSY